MSRIAFLVGFLCVDFWAEAGGMGSAAWGGGEWWLWRGGGAGRFGMYDVKGGPYLVAGGGRRVGRRFDAFYMSGSGLTNLGHNLGYHEFLQFSYFSSAKS